MGDPALSAELAVVIPALNEEARLPRLLARLAECRAAGEAQFDVWVVDGGSRDRTVEVARAAGASVVSSEPGRGLQLAAGARACSAPLLVFLHADCVPEVGSLAAVRRTFEDPAVVATGMRQKIEAPERFYRWVERAASARVRRGLVYGDSGLGVRRQTYEESGGFSSQPLFEDLELSRRLRRLGAVVLVDGAELSISARRWKSEGALRRTLKNWALTVGYYFGMDPARLVRYYSVGRR